MSEFWVAVIATSGAFFGALLGAIVNLRSERTRQEHQRQERESQQKYERAKERVERRADLYARLLAEMTELPYAIVESPDRPPDSRAASAAIHAMTGEVLLYGTERVRDLTVTRFGPNLQAWYDRWEELKDENAQRPENERKDASAAVWTSYWEMFYPYVEELAEAMRESLEPD